MKETLKIHWGNAYSLAKVPVVCLFLAVTFLALFPTLLPQRIIHSLNIAMGLAGTAITLIFCRLHLQTMDSSRELQLDLIKQEARLGRVIAAMHEAWWDWDLVGKEHYLSPKWWQLFGYGEREVDIDLEILYSWLHPDDVNTINAAFETAMKGNAGAFEAEMRIRHKQGHYVSVLTRAQITKDDHGRPIRFSGVTQDLSAKSQTEEILNESLVFMSMLRDAMIVADADFRVKRWNRAAESIYGWKAEEALGRRLREVLGLRFSEDEGRAILSKLDADGYWRGEVQHSRKDGVSIPIEVDTKVLRSHAGHISGYLMFNRDLSSRKAAESEIRKVHALHATILRTAPYALISVDPEGLVTSWNPAAERMLGRTEDEMVGRQSLSILIDAEEMARRAHEFSAELGAGIAPGFEAVVAKARVGLPNAHPWTLIRKDAGRVPVLLNVSAIPASDGAIAGFLAVASDRTVENRANQVAAEAARKMTAAMMSLNEQKFAMDQHSLVSVADAAGKITYANEKLCEISGFSREELVGRDHRILNSKYHPKEFFTDLYRTITAGQVWHGEIRNQRKSGGYYWVDTTIVPFLDTRGKPRQFVSIRTDITARKVAETDLLVAKESAESSNRAKSEFLATMSHEIRTPLNGVLGLTHLLLDTHLSGEQKDLIDTMRQSGVVLLSIINDILDYSKIEAGKMDVEFIPFSLEESIRDVMDILSLQAAEKKLGMKLDYPEALARTALCDPGRVRQVLMNLINNAIKFTQQGGLSISVHVEGDRFRIEIADTGIGIPLEKQDRIFAKFSQADASTTRRFGGTGLGLAISRKLAELMRGELGFSSVPGVGSTFWLIIPIAPPEIPSGGIASKPDWAPVAGEPTQAVAMPKPGLRVLLAEDNMVNQKVAAGMLKKWGCVVDFALNGLEAVDMVKRFPYAMVFMDCQMPEMDGWEATRQIRAWEASSGSLGRPRLAIVAVTANTMAGDREQCLQAGMDDFLSKPIRAPEMQRMLRLAVTEVAKT